MAGRFTKAQFERWDAMIGVTSPGAASADEIAGATLVTGCVLQAMSDCIIMRLTDETGLVRTFNLNPAVALRLADSIPAAARMAEWLDDKGVVMALTRLPHRRSGGKT